MIKIFTAVAGLSLMAAAPASADNGRYVDSNPKHLKFKEVQDFSRWEQIGVYENVSEAKFRQVNDKAAVFIDLKTKKEAFMRCAEVDGNLAIGEYSRAPKSFMKELKRAHSALGCKQPALI